VVKLVEEEAGEWPFRGRAVGEIGGVARPPLRHQAAEYRLMHGIDRSKPALRCESASLLIAIVLILRFMKIKTIHNRVRHNTSDA
jgi:hypothetical protein